MNDEEYDVLFIMEYVDCDYDTYDCNNCQDAEFCESEANRICNSEYARSIDFGGFDTEEEFWEDLFD